MSMQIAHRIRAELHSIVDNGLGTADIGQALAGPIQQVQEECFAIALKSVQRLDKVLQGRPHMRANLTEAVLVDDLNSRAARHFELWQEAKQCLAYLELAKRGDPKLLLWAWLNNSSEPREQDKACGDVVNAMNTKVAGSRIQAAGLMQENKGIVKIQEFPLGARLQKAEERAGLTAHLANVLKVGTAVLGSMMTGSMLAGVCKEWQTRVTMP